MIDAGATGRAPIVRAGAFRRILDPSSAFGRPAYINDHGFVHDGDRWHVFAIARHEPFRPHDEKALLHASSPSLVEGPWEIHDPAIVADPDLGEKYAWAPFVVRGLDAWWMYWASGGDDIARSAISVARSTDLFAWERLPTGPAFRDGAQARDPMVLSLEDRWVMYYTATDDPAGGRHTVCSRESTDLVAWTDRRVVYRDPSTGDDAGPTESPFVVPVGSQWVLLTGPRGDYDRTAVFYSDDPFSFDVTRRAGWLPAHAPEVVTDVDGRLYISRCGWGRGGLWLAPLELSQP